jgi:hypothetical protein
VNNVATNTKTISELATSIKTKIDKALDPIENLIKDRRCTLVPAPLIEPITSKVQEIAELKQAAERFVNGDTDVLPVVDLSELTSSLNELKKSSTLIKTMIAGIPMTAVAA